MKINYLKIYEKLGYLFYAIAAADHRVHEAEVEKLKSLIAKEWLPLENSTDKYGTDAGHYISISFEYLLTEGIPSDEAYAVFSDYYQIHPVAFSKELKQKISSTATAIASSFANRNKSEREYIAQLQKLMK